MRSTSFTMRSASSQISRVSVRSSSLDRLLEQLRGAADAGQRVLDLVRQHGGERDHRARGAAMGELAVHLVGDGALLQHHHDVVRPLGQRRDMQVDEALARIARRAEIDLVFVDRRAALAHLLDQRQQRAAERHQVAQRVPAQQRQRRFEEGFRRHIGVGDLAVGRDHDDRMRQARRARRRPCPEQHRHGVACGSCRRRSKCRSAPCRGNCSRDESHRTQRELATGGAGGSSAVSTRVAVSFQQRDRPRQRSRPRRRAPSRDACAHGGGRSRSP